MKLSILVPVYNEQDTLEKVISKLKSLDVEEKEIIIIDDGSVDNTGEILRNMEKNLASTEKIKIIFHEKNQGKGMAIRTGLKHVSGEIVAIQDADLEYNPEEIPKLVEHMTEFDVIYGSRFLGLSNSLPIYKRYLLGNKFLTWLTNLLYNANFTDTYTCYKIFRREVLEKLDLESKRFEMEAELSCKVAKGKYRFKEIPIKYTPRSIEEGKKIGWADAFRGIITILKYL